MSCSFIFGTPGLSVEKREKHHHVIKKKKRSEKEQNAMRDMTESSAPATSPIKNDGSSEEGS
jgi:hypothetical protein